MTLSANSLNHSPDLKANDENASPLPRIFGRYELLEVIGRGGMGVIHKARQLGLDRICAVKTLSDERFRETASRDQLLKEARAAASLQHPNIVSIFEVGEAEGHVFFSMEYVEGVDLAVLTRRRALPAEKIAECVKKVADAIAYAHRKGVLHCDLKPANVIIDVHDEPRVTDFGLTQPACGATDSAGDAWGAGSPNFLAPEQASTRFGPLSEKTDVYGLGATLYYLLTDRPPSRGENLKFTLNAVISIDPVRPRTLRPGVPLDLETICLKCLEKRPAKRYASVSEVADELHRFLEGEPVQARPISVLELLIRRARRQPWAAGFALATATLLVVIALGSSLAAYHIDQVREQEMHQRYLAEAHELQLRRELYAADLTRASDAFAGGRYSQVHSLIDGYRPGAGAQGPDLRGWEWYYLNNASQGDFEYDLKGEAPNPVQLVRIAPQTCVTLGRDGSMQRIGLATRKVTPLRPSVGRTNDAGLMCLRADGRQLAVAMADIARTNTLLDIYSLPDFQPVAHTEYPAVLAGLGWSEDGKEVLACAETSSRGTFSSRLVALTAGGSRPLANRVWTTRRPLVPVFSDDGRQVALNNDDGSLAVLNLATGAERPLVGHDYEPGWSILITSMRFDPTGRYLITTGMDRTARVWNTESGAAIHTLRGHDDIVLRGAFSPDGRTVVTAGRDHSLRIWRLDTGAEVGLLSGGTDTTSDVLFTADSQNIITSDPEHGVRSWPVSPTRPWQQSFPLPMETLWAEATPSGTSWWWINTARQWYLRPGEQAIEAAKASDNIHARAYDERHNREAWASESGLILTDRGSGRERKITLSHPQMTARVHFSRDGSLIAVSMENHGGLAIDDSPSFLAVYEADSGTLQREFSGPSFKPVFSTDNRWLVAGDWSGSSRLYNLTTGTFQDLPSHSGQAIAFAFSPDNRLLATGGVDGVVQVTVVTTGKSLPPIDTRTRGVVAVVFSPDQNRLVTGTVDGLIQFWDTTLWRNVGTLYGHQKLISSLVFRDPTTLVSVGLDQVRVWKTTGMPPPIAAPLKGAVM